MTVLGRYYAVYLSLQLNISQITSDTMTDSNDRFRISRSATETLESLPRYLPGAALNAPKRNALVVLVYVFALLLLAGKLWMRF
jgi:hypothetical protein